MGLGTGRMLSWLPAAGSRSAPGREGERAGLAASCPATSCLSMALSGREEFCPTCLLLGKKIIVNKLLAPKEGS